MGNRLVKRIPNAKEGAYTVVIPQKVQMPEKHLHTGSATVFCNRCTFGDIGVSYIAPATKDSRFLIREVRLQAGHGLGLRLRAHKIQ